MSNESADSSTSPAGHIACSGDVTFREPPAVEAWNDRELERYNNSSWSRYPARVDSNDGLVANTSYVEIFSTNPSTVVHTETGTTQYVRPNGTVRTVGSYNGSALGCANTSDFCVLESVSVNEVGLYANGTRQDTAASPTAELQYRNLTGPTTLTVRLSLSVTVNQTTVTGDSNITTYNRTLRDSRQVTAYEVTPSDVEVSLANHRNSTGASLAVPKLWRSVTFKTGDVVYSRWRFYTRSPPGWERWNTSSGTNVSSAQRIRPLQVHAIPARQGPLANLDQHSLAGDAQFFQLGDDYDRIQLEFVVSYRNGTTANKSQLPVEVQLTQSRTHTRTERFTLRANDTHPLSDYRSPTVHGIVRGEKTESRLSTTAVVDAYPANMSATVVNRTTNGTTLAVTVRSTRGHPVDFGNVTVVARNSTRIHTLAPDERGVFNITVPERALDRVTLTYSPKYYWWEQGNPVVSDIVATERTTTVEWLDAGHPKFVDIANLVVVTILWFLPLGLLLYGFDVWTNGRLLGVYSS
ncbi:hypothetical protein [Haloarcula amylovorans]|uniref:hypothetical protein n=1 Tax=Haloarcula amylovorans TaxID=2562280 RepID=UPI001076050E|nr:hypothetical protein [Halomicroarcula amylolytica]